MRGGRAVVALLLAGSTVTACADPASSPAGTTGPSAGSVAVSAGPATTSRSTAPTMTAPAPGSRPAAAPSHGYVAGLTRSAGTDGAVTYDVQVPTLTGGSRAVTDRFDAAMRTTLRDWISAQTKAPVATVREGRLASGDTSRVTHIGSRVVAGVFLVNADNRGAHPYTMIGTVVIDTTTARPILLTDLFTDRTKGLARLNALVSASRDTPGGFAAFTDGSAEALANWVPSPAGLTVYAGVSHASGDFYPVTVPWSELKDVVAPAMWPVVTS